MCNNFTVKLLYLLVLGVVLNVCFYGLQQLHGFDLYDEIEYCLNKIK